MGLKKSFLNQIACTRQKRDSAKANTDSGYSITQENINYPLDFLRKNPLKAIHSRATSEPLRSSSSK